MITRLFRISCIKPVFGNVLVLVFLLSSSTIMAQFSDGTKATSAWINEIRANMEDEQGNAYNEASVFNTVSLSVIGYVIRDEDGRDNCDIEAIETSFSVMNDYFADIHLRFVLQPIQYINDYNYGKITGAGDYTELVRKHSAEKTINLYLVESIIIDSLPRYGFTFFPSDSDKNYLFLDKDFITGNYLTTLMGHFFGLLSTHETLGGIEFVNESNCSSSGDFLCDTWADPNILGQVDTTCAYMGLQIDSHGQFYVPSVANLMAESLDRCKCVFTPYQYRRMLFCLKKYRYYLR